MKLYTFFTDSHKVLLKYFLNTFQFEPNIDLVIRYFDQPNIKEFADANWKSFMYKKVDYIIDSINETDPGDWFIHCDADIVFYDKLYPYLREYIEKFSDYDLIFQNDYGGGFCNGFFLCKSSDETLNFWKDVKKQLINYPHDQLTSNNLLPLSKLKYMKFDEKIYTYGNEYKKWEGQEITKLPLKIIVHHANWTEGVDNKVKLINKVKSLYE